MSHSRPLTLPSWGPGRPMVVSDPGKLSYFARANAVRTGIRTTGVGIGVSGLGNLGYAVADNGGTGVQESDVTLQQPGGPQTINRIVPTSVARYTNPDPGYTYDPMASYDDNTANGPTTSANTLNSNGTMLLDRFFNMFNSVLGRNPNYSPAPMVQAQTGPDWGMILGVGVLAVGGVWVLKKVAKK